MYDVCLLSNFQLDIISAKIAQHFIQVKSILFKLTQMLQRWLFLTTGSHTLYKGNSTYSKENININHKAQNNFWALT